MKSISLEEIAKKLASHQKIVFLSHTNPDGDTVGSVSALAYALKGAGKDICCLCDCDIPERLKFICGELYEKDISLSGEELIVSVDVAAPSMLGALDEKFSPIVDIQIDHHGKGIPFGKASYVDASAAAAGEIVFQLLTYMQLTSNIKAISSIYAAIASDTGCFKYSNTTAQTHMSAAYLLSLGVNSAEINEALFDTVSFESLSVYPLFLENCKVMYDGKVNLVLVTNKVKKKYSLKDSDLDELSAIARKVGGAELGIVIRQKDGSDCEYKVSMRSRAPISCSDICSKLGGGGHLRAAGATFFADAPENALESVLTLLSQYFK